MIAGLTEDDYCSLDDSMIEKYTHMFKHPEMFIQVAGEIRALPVPDHTITTEQLMEYGHNPYGIAPLREKMAHKLFDTGLRVYNLIPGGGAERTQSHEDIVEHAEKGGYFAIDKGQWMMFIDKKSLEKVEELLEDDYNMVDGIINNGVKEDRSEKKSSVMEKLQEKKVEASMMEKVAPKQEKTKAIEIE